jgi:cation/acetate symporter
VLWATLFMNLFFALTFVIGFGALAVVGGDPAYVDAAGKLIGGGNMAALHLASAVGGPVLLGFISAVAFATILAVVAGLTLAGAAAISHDLYACTSSRPVDEADELRLSRIATLAIGVLAVGLGLAFRSQNVAYMVSLAFAIACSSTFPVLLLSIYWRGLTTRGAVAGGTAGLLTAVVATVLGPAVWVGVLGNPSPLVMIDPPALLSLPVAFLGCWGVSVLDHGPRAAIDRSGFDAQMARSA